MLELKETELGPNRTILPEKLSIAIHFLSGSISQLTILLVHAPELEMTITLVSVVQLVSIRDLCQERTRVLGKRVEEDSIHNNSECLNHQKGQ